MNHKNGQQIGKIHLTDGAMEKLIAERDAKAQHHLNEMGKDQGITDSAMNAVVLAAIQRDGLPENPAEFYEKCRAIASVISTAQIRRKHEGVRDLLKHLNIHQCAPALIWSAKQAGVEMFPEAEAQS